jgi:hypothetical protein
MDGLAIIQVSGAVVALMYLLRWAGLSRRWAPLLVPVLSALGVGVWVYGQAPIGQADTFSYVAGWVAVATSAATVWGFTWAGGEGHGRPTPSVHESGKHTPTEPTGASPGYSKDR